MNLFVYSGPSADFSDYVENILPEDLDRSEVIQFSTISDEVSARQHGMRVYTGEEPPVGEMREEKAYLVCGKDDYSTVTSAGINAFASLSEKYKFKNIILHNPPHKLIEKLSSRYAIEKPFYKSYDYKNVSKKTILSLKAELDKRILGQDQAIYKVLASLLMASAIQNNDKSPLVIMFYGASGSGKTEMAKTISEVIDGAGNLFRRQLSMHQNIHSANYLFGGEHGEESLARDLMQRKSNVILFDEFDKLNQSLYSAFYQLFDEGLFEDINYSVETSRSVIICTSNFNSEEHIKEALGEPIFSRFDACIEFNPLSSVFMQKVADKIYDKYYSELDDEQKAIVNDNEGNIKKFMHEIAVEVKNVRIVERYIRQRIASTLLDSFLGEASSKAI